MAKKKTINKAKKCDKSNEVYDLIRDTCVFNNNKK